MPELTVHAIVLRRRDSGESDRRLVLLTSELGKIEVVAKGARKSASRLAGSSDPLTHAVMNLASGKATRYVTQAQPMGAFRGLRTDFERLSFGLALGELYAAVLPYDEPAPEAFELLGTSLGHLEVHPKPLVALVWAEMRLMELSGFMPQFDSCVVSGIEVREAEPFVSPKAGGYVSEAEAGAFSDRFRTRAEVLYGLSRIVELEAPPSNLKLAIESLQTLLAFWRHIADLPLPANDAALATIRGLH